MPVLGRIELAQRVGSGPVWGLVASVAAQQHGVVGRWQLLALGVGRSVIERALVRGQLHPVHLGVYSVGVATVGVLARHMAAVLAGGEGAMLSHCSAGALLRFIARWPSPIDVIARRCGRERRPGLRMHRPRTLPSTERWEREGVPVTNPTRTLIDLAAVLDEPALQEAVHGADRQRCLDIDRINGSLRQTPGRPGVRKLTKILAAYRPLPVTRSWLQDRFLFECDQAGIPRPAADVVVEGFEVDCLWPAERVIVELDSYGYHANPDAFEADRRRDVALTLAGYVVLRFTYERVTRERAAVMRELRMVLDRARSLPGPDPTR